MPLDSLPKRTQTQAVYETLRQEIVTCRLRPGEKLRINELADRFDCSPGAVREALSRLTADGFVDGVAQKGSVVRPASVDDLRDLTETRIELECSCLRGALAQGDARWEGQLLAAAHELRSTPITDASGTQANEAWYAVHEAFHRVLVSACRSPWRLRLREILYEQTTRYHHLLPAPQRNERDVMAEHEALLQAALAHDSARATHLLSEHLERTRSILLAHMQEWQPAAP